MDASHGSLAGPMHRAASIYRMLLFDIVLQV